jgi:hypothetical protein
VDRRSFLKALSLAAAGFILDEATGLMVPRRKLWQVSSTAPLGEPLEVPTVGAEDVAQLDPGSPLPVTNPLSQFLKTWWCGGFRRPTTSSRSLRGIRWCGGPPTEVPEMHLTEGDSMLIVNPRALMNIKIKFDGAEWAFVEG